MCNKHRRGLLVCYHHRHHHHQQPRPQGFSLKKWGRGCIITTTTTTIIGELKQLRRRLQRRLQKLMPDFISDQSLFEMMTPQLETFSVTLMGTTGIKQFYRWTTLFGTFLCRPCTTTTWNFLISRFVGNLNKRHRIYLLFLRFLGNSTPGEFAYITLNERIGKNIFWVEWVTWGFTDLPTVISINLTDKVFKTAQSWSLGS